MEGVQKFLEFSGMNQEEFNAVVDSFTDKSLFKLMRTECFCATKNIHFSKSTHSTGRDSLSESRKDLQICMTLELRKATFADSRFLFELRNDASVREVSFSTEAISFESHTKWLTRKLQDSRTSFYIAETKDGDSLAQVRFNVVDAKTAEVNIAVTKRYRGKGYGTLILTLASRRFFEEQPFLMSILARIKPNNPSSLRSFEKAGYKRIEPDAQNGGQAVEMQLSRPVLQIQISKRLIGEGAPCFIVAEISGNHHQKYEEAVALMRAAKEAGADAVKIQTYTPDTITLNSDKEWFRMEGEENPENWKGKTLYQLYQETYTPWEWQPKLKRIADELGIILFSTPFDETSVDFLETMNVPCYKIASYEVTDFLLLRKVARTGKPVIMSVGYASVEEIEFALKTLRENGAKEIALLHCATGYAEQPEITGIHLSTIRDLQTRFKVVGGFSDNNAGIDIPLLAVASAARILEKHIILDRRRGGPDARFSLEPAELKEMIRQIRTVESGKKAVTVSGQALGKPHYGSTNAIEEYNKRWRRSLFSGRNIRKGELFTKENVRDVRPAFGLSTRYFDGIMGKRAARDIPFATPLSFDVIE